MTENEAHSLAAQRERHKSKHMTHKRWTAMHDSVKGWHVALIDTPSAVAAPAPGVTVAGIAVCVALFGPEATAQALAMLARRDERMQPSGGTFKPPSTGREISIMGESSPEFIIPNREVEE